METLSAVLEKEPSPYERKALAEIRVWKNPDMGWFGKAVDRVNRVVHDATELVRKVPGVDWTIENVVSGILRLTNEVVQDSVQQGAILKEYREAGVAVGGPGEIGGLDLEVVDARLRGLDTKYRSFAALEGAAAGYVGAVGIVPDIVALVALNLRAAGEYAAYCGFDVSDPEERLFALEVLNAVSAPSDLSKEVALAPIFRVTQRLARDQSVQAVQQFAVTRAIRNAAQGLGVRLTAAKLAQVVPITGAIVGGGFNAYYTSKVCDAAFFLYRERFLARKYGEAVSGE